MDKIYGPHFAIYLFINRNSSNVSPYKKLKTILITLLIISNSLFGLSYFITIFLHEDSRVTAANFAKNVIPQNVQVVSEMYDLGVTAFSPYVKSITLFNTYDLDTNSPDYNLETWNNTLSKSDFIILPSQRVLQTRLMNKKRYQNGYIVYDSLLNGQSGFQKIYETPCDIFCKITYLGDPIYYFEQTVNVFDRPTVMIFKKTSLY